ncbi:hypothetical protein DSO57_1012409 [Entomophthora muscae]|uniref:Uncharacterized protein n=1 Tax=Entomophthora muscae TaxID=34485 RepID=A0ACC2USA6_9FUNG|nr:hypothetical protein DSO57_1012409 [Entomophthora muscae]
MEGDSFWNQHPKNVKKRLQSLSSDFFQHVISHSPEEYLNITSATLYLHAATIISDAAVILPLHPHPIPSHQHLLGWDIWSYQDDLDWEEILRRFDIIPSTTLTLPEMVYRTCHKSLYVISIQAFSWMVTGTYVNAPKKVGFHARFPVLLNSKHPYGQVKETNLCHPKHEFLLNTILKSSNSWTPAKAISKCLEL